MRHTIDIDISPERLRRSKLRIEAREKGWYAERRRNMGSPRPGERAG